ncbi:hypothetical protein Bhyg_15079 [Pseudolycoriella hygida]|uniref:Gustatory receptor n=1 Tax=Pseudolycoriella hygida TaxID=35572 RepID=A0A9Q0MRV8_9DIPT|nr:hypothetical protein Bhyg_15079 [Pseudolycoriella hygida]
MASAHGAFHTKIHHSKLNRKCLIIEENTLKKYKGFETSDHNELIISKKAAISAPDEVVLNGQDDSQIIEIFAKKMVVLETYIDTICGSKEHLPSLPIRLMEEGLKIEKIVDGGDQANRIDVVFMGDGYTADEQDQFFDDIRRLTDDMFNGDTFRSYLPLFNIWAVFVESSVSGIGYDGPNDTPFRLYREAGQLRAIYTANSQYARQVCQLMGPGGCDYPSLIANDDYYGGLGGEFVISTKSNRTGTVVLRHEMGHSFINVGDEYDNGPTYYGVNSAASLAGVENTWGHWLSGESVREERVIYRLLEYPWANLSLSEQSFSFSSDGQYSRWYLLLSVSAAGEEDSLEFILDGEILPWQSRGSDDREFYDWYRDEGLAAGNHTFSVRSKTPSTNVNIPRMICSVQLHEFGNEDEFHIGNDYISAYPVWDERRRVTYRPTNAGCLMRNMTNIQFCSVCKEGMWHQFLRRISLIDGISVSKVPNADSTKRVVLKTLKLGQLRESGNEVDNERLEVRWSHSGLEQTEFNDRFEIDAKIGYWSVSVQLITDEVRNDPNQLLQDIEHFTVLTFANRIKHENVEITCSKLFVINTQLVFSIISSTVSYLVILVQFELEIEKQ